MVHATAEGLAAAAQELVGKSNFVLVCVNKDAEQRPGARRVSERRIGWQAHGDAWRDIFERPFPHLVELLFEFCFGNGFEVGARRIRHES